ESQLTGFYGTLAREDGPAPPPPAASGTSDGEEKPEEQVRQAGGGSIGCVARSGGGLREDPVRGKLGRVLDAVRGGVRRALLCQGGHSQDRMGPGAAGGRAISSELAKRPRGRDARCQGHPCHAPVRRPGEDRQKGRRPGVQFDSADDRALWSTWKDEISAARAQVTRLREPDIAAMFDRAANEDLSLDTLMVEYETYMGLSAIQYAAFTGDVQMLERAVALGAALDYEHLPSEPQRVNRGHRRQAARLDGIVHS
ncbi:hypothetical protein THAOC_11721, partial [Thalassiosira oceanica]